VLFMLNVIYAQCRKLAPLLSAIMLNVAAPRGRTLAFSSQG
jgi:hypothetical protein